jgi:hypothetical protein
VIISIKSEDVLFLIEREGEGDPIGDGSLREMVRVIDVDRDERTWVVVRDVVKDLLFEGVISFVVGNAEHLVIRVLFAMGVSEDGFDNDEALLFLHGCFLS